MAMTEQERARARRAAQHPRAVTKAVDARRGEVRTPTLNHPLVTIVRDFRDTTMQTLATAFPEAEVTRTRRGVIDVRWPESEEG